MKKIILGLGAMMAVTAPVVVAVSCNEEDTVSHENRDALINKLRTEPEGVMSCTYGQDLGVTVAAVLNAHEEIISETELSSKWGYNITLAAIPSYNDTKVFTSTHDLSLSNDDILTLKRVYTATLTGTQGAVATKDLNQKQKVEKELQNISEDVAHAILEAFAN